MTDPPRSHLRRRTLLAYAGPAFAFAMPTIPVYVYLPAMYADDLGIGLAATGAVLLVARAFDTVTDPLVGVLSDRLGLPGGKRKPWVVVGAAVAALGLYNLLVPAPGVTWVHLLAWLLVLYTGWTAVMVPYTAWGAELSPDYHERTRITAFREGAMLVGILVAGALPAAVAQFGASEREGLVAVAWTAIVVGGLALAALARLVPDEGSGIEEPRAGPGEPWHLALGRVIRALAGNQPFLRLVAAWFVNGLANGLPAVLFLLYLEHALGAGPAERPMFVLVYFLAGVLAIPLWQRLSRHYGKHRVWCGAMLLAVVTFAFVPLIPPGGFAAFFAVCVLTGMALGADLALPPALQADVIDLDRLRHGRERAGLYFAIWSMGTKLALGIAAGAGLTGVSALGFDPALPTAEGRWALVTFYAAVPVVLKVGAVTLVWRFPITPGRQAIIRRRLEARAIRARRAATSPPITGSRS